jgi:hypothetical protein
MTSARRLYEGLEIIPVDDHNTEIAVSLLHRFFQEEGFFGDRSIIATNLDRMRRDDNHWAAVALNNGHNVGIVTNRTFELNQSNIMYAHPLVDHHVKEERPPYGPIA